MASDLSKRRCPVIFDGNEMEWTIKSLIQWSSKNLAEKGIDSAHLDSEVLLAHVLNTERTNLFINAQRALTLSEVQQFKKLQKRRSCREPLPYIIGYKEFWSLCFKVNCHVLIPRPETETLVQKSLEILKEYYSNHTGLVYINDIGTGCGNIAISLCKELKYLYIVATDYSGEALSTAIENARLNNISTQVCFQKRELFGKLITNRGRNKFDLIVSNPPYIPTDEIKTLAPEIKFYEPHRALDGGSDGLNFFKIIIAEIHNYLSNGGYIIFEMGYKQAKVVSNMLRKQGCFSNIETTKDYGGTERVISARFQA